jgi:hypothetical protein
MKRKANLLLILVLALAGIVAPAAAQNADTTKTAPEPPKEEKKKKWYDVVSFGGYTQVRYNRLLETNEDLKCDQCDKSWGKGQGIFIRRGRLKFSGDVHPRVYFYIQTDIAASASSTGLHFLQIRDAYFDLGLDAKKTFKMRVGQSKVPFGFENLQSSQNRIAFDRSDPLNSAVPNERDLGVFVYWTPEKIKERFNYLQKSGLKGSGDYGVFGIGVYNGQTANRPELNDEPHAAARLTWPFEIKGQYIETSVQGYNGRYVLPNDLRSSGVEGNEEFDDQRVAGSLIVYPQPIGFQAEYNVGRGPEFNPGDSTIATRDLSGGYGMLMYRFKIKDQVFIPYVRSQVYTGGKKLETDARHYDILEHEIGVEWEPVKYFELTAAYTIADRTYEDFKKPDNRQQGNLLRLQLQFNY